MLEIKSALFKEIRQIWNKLKDKTNLKSMNIFSKQQWDQVLRKGKHLLSRKTPVMESLNSNMGKRQTEKRSTYCCITGNRSITSWDTLIPYESINSWWRSYILRRDNFNHYLMYPFCSYLCDNSNAFFFRKSWNLEQARDYRINCET